ncbi:c-type cytochrome [Simplicispira suum]|uniref:Cytochrome C n=1 Tax=Simplicispira suum TaxID=2109915 RepID=A0A2S0MYD4_9BURK|nr:cytochrome c [Simplicispira suum]AVO40900.1 cytochrome C [Simplicispira suum]MBW7834848.1 cytochrome c [Simplicispira suum]
MKTFAALALSIATLSFAAPAAAQFEKPEDAIKYRQSALFVMGQHFGRIGAMANGKIPFDAKVAQENADIVVIMAKLPWAGFGPGTDKGRDTKAKPEIWTEQAKFREHADKMGAETVKLATAAQTGDLDKLKSAFGETAKSCKACHDNYRNK